MANQKVSLMPDAATLDGNEIIPVIQDLNNKKVELSEVSSFIRTGLMQEPVTPTFTSEVRFDNFCSAPPEMTLTGDTTFTVDDTGAKPGYMSIRRVNTAGHTVNFQSPFKMLAGSLNISSTDTNKIYFWYDGVDFLYCNAEYITPAAWESFIFAAVDNITRTGNNYVITAATGANGRAFAPTKKIPAANPGGYRFPAGSMWNYGTGLHTSSVNQAWVYDYYAVQRDHNAGVLVFRENSSVVGSAAVPVGATDFAFLKDDLGEVTFCASLDGGITFSTVLHTYVQPATGDLYPLLEIGFNDFFDVFSNPQILGGV